MRCSRDTRGLLGPITRLHNSRATCNRDASNRPSLTREAARASKSRRGLCAAAGKTLLAYVGTAYERRSFGNRGTPLTKGVAAPSHRSRAVEVGIGQALALAYCRAHHLPRGPGRMYVTDVAGLKVRNAEPTVFASHRQPGIPGSPQPLPLLVKGPPTRMPSNCRNMPRRRAQTMPGVHRNGSEPGGQRITVRQVWEVPWGR